MKLFSTAILTAFLQATVDARGPTKARCEFVNVDDTVEDKSEPKLIFRQSEKWVKSRGVNGLVNSELQDLNSAADYSVLVLSGADCTGDEVESPLSDLIYPGGV